MLNPDNNIKCVELQANVKLGLDDVVVTYEGGEKLFVQVKHTYIVVQQTTHTNMDLPSRVLFLLNISYNPLQVKHDLNIILVYLLFLNQFYLFCRFKNIQLIFCNLF